MGTKSPIKLKLRSSTFKCDLCGRKYTSSSALDFHKQCVHSKAMKTIKTDTAVPSKPKKVIIKLKQPLKSKKTMVAKKKKGIPQSKLKTITKTPKMLNKKVTIQDPLDDVKQGPEYNLSEPEFRRTKFECPKCKRIYSVYFQAYKHIQKYHCMNSKGQQVKPSSGDLIKPIAIELCTLCRKRLSSSKHECTVTTELEDIKFASKYVCSGCHASFVSMKMYDLHVSGLHSDGVQSMFFPTVKEFYDWKMNMEDEMKTKYTLLGKYNSKQYYRCSFLPFVTEADTSTATFCPSTIAIQQFPKGIQVHFYTKHYGHQCENYELSGDCDKYNIAALVNTKSSKVLDLKCYEVELYSGLKNLMSAIIVDAAKAKDSTLKQLLEKTLEMASILKGDNEINKLDSTAIVEAQAKNRIMTDRQISEALQNGNNTSPVKVQRVPPAKRVAEEEKIDAKRPKREKRSEKSTIKIVDAFSITERPDIENILKEGNEIEKAERQDAGINKNSLKKDKKNDIKVINDSPRAKSYKVSFASSPTFVDTYKDFVDKNFKISSDKKKNVVKTKIGQFKPNSPKSLKNKAKKIEPKDLSKVKITDYEVKERENDCNILILKI